MILYTYLSARQVERSAIGSGRISAYDGGAAVVKILFKAPDETIFLKYIYKSV